MYKIQFSTSSRKSFTYFYVKIKKINVKSADYSEYRKALNPSAAP